MFIGIHNLYEQYNKRNAIFNPNNYNIGSYLWYGNVCLGNLFLANKHTIATLDLLPAPDKIIFIDHPNWDNNKLKEYKNKGIKLYLIAQENIMVRPQNYDPEIIDLYDKVFTWNTDYVDNKKCFKFYNPTKMVSLPDKGMKNKYCLSTMISCNKAIEYPGELYRERINVIDYFQEKHPHDFHLFGYGWQGYTSWRGIAKYKLETLSWYKFAFCYENLLNDNEYITEKIFDVMSANTIPIYYGFKNIEKFIPENCMIRLESFDKDYEKLYKHISKMSTIEYEQYMKNIQEYIKSDKAKIFSGEHFAETIYNEVIKE